MTMYLIEIIIGVLLGFVIGLIPSIHINTISYFFLFIGGYNLFYNNSFFFISLAVSQLVTSYVSISVFGVPNDSTIMHLFPLQRLAKEGQLKKGIYLCLVGSFFGGLFSLLLFPILFLLFSALFNFNLFIYGLIILILIMFIILEKNIKKRIGILAIIILAGTLGIFTLKYNYFLSEPLMVCVVGLFAFPFILESIFSKNRFVKQKDEDLQINLKDTGVSSFLGTLGAMFMIIVPSFSSSQASYKICLRNSYRLFVKNSLRLILYTHLYLLSLLSYLYICVPLSLDICNLVNNSYSSSDMNSNNGLIN